MIGGLKMSVLQSDYAIIEDAPKPVDEDVYYDLAGKEYMELIEQPLHENVYQAFFEKNPAFMPGSREIIGAANSHWPIMNALISQPILSNDLKVRKPDFMWIAKNSLCLCPVLIEIEKPSKAEFRSNSDIGRQVFNQAMDQIIHWKAILESEKGRADFYERYSIPEKYRRLKFKPQYLLVFGRRSEYECDEWLTSMRAGHESADIRIMSFDRLAVPDRNAYDCVTCKVTNGKYKVINIPPTFVFKPSTINAIENYSELEGFVAAVETMKHTSDERKQFLKNRYAYWVEYSKKTSTGLCNTSDKE